MKQAERTALESFAHRVRRHVIGMSGGGGCFLGASLSCTDLITYLYRRFLRFDPARPTDPARDIMLLSKGHDVPALYGAFVELGMLDVARLGNHLSPFDHIYWHPNRAIPGIEFHSGSLGHCLSVAMGIAYDVRLRGDDNRVVVLLGDGELNEGSVWEALLVASAYKLDNLVVVVDRNGFQANVMTEDLIPLEPLDAKFEAFGCAATTVDGHDFDDLDRGFGRIPITAGRPSVVIAKTIRGKGVAQLEGRADRWFCRFSDVEVSALLDELEGGAETQIEAEALVVR
ncbi:MAG: 1-deoxy-D-xylulose-5-phosphate synthase N-terminal domain-containing protein [bacterium]